MSHEYQSLARIFELGLHLHPSGYFATLRGIDYSPMVWRDGTVTIQVGPGRSEPESGFVTDSFGWSRKVYSESDVERVFVRESVVLWRGNRWSVLEFSEDRTQMECLLLGGNTRVADLADDARTWRGDSMYEFWARLNLTVVDALTVLESEVVQGVKDQSTTRQVFSWPKFSANGTP